MHYTIQSALLGYNFPFLILVCFIRLVYRTSNFQIVAIAHELGERYILPSVALVIQQVCVVS